MSNQVNIGCCVCLEPAETKAQTPCNHPEPRCESCFQKVPHCPLCRTPFNNGVAPIEFSDDEADDVISDYNRALVTAVGSGHEALVRSLLDHGANDFNRTIAIACFLQPGVATKIL